MLRQITYGDLKDQIGMEGPRPFLRCPACEAECSANAGDYWNMNKAAPILCGNCLHQHGERVPMRRVLRKSSFQEV